MPNEGMKISQLPAATEVLDSDVLAGVGGGVTRKFTFATISSYIQTKLTALFAAKQDKITANGVLQGDGNGGVTARNVDATPTASSTNLVTSGGVKNAIDQFKPISVRLARQRKAVITLSTYECALRIFGVSSNEFYCDMIYSYGYVIQLDNNPEMSISRSSDYLTITVSNNATSSRTMDLAIVFCERDGYPLTWSVDVQDIT